jgi:Holliday junction resolvasome RuvABC endonuclease subunit
MAAQAESIETDQLLDMGAAVIGIDPGSMKTGIALLDGKGALRETWDVSPPAAWKMPKRQAYICARVNAAMKEARQIVGPDVRVTVVIEEGVFGWGKEPAPARIRTAAIVGEMRGMIMALAWNNGFYVQKMPVVTWKSRLTKVERKMTKDKTYVAYWNEKLGAHFHSPDEVDAALIGRRASGL